MQTRLIALNTSGRNKDLSGLISLIKIAEAEGRIEGEIRFITQEDIYREDPATEEKILVGPGLRIVGDYSFLEILHEITDHRLGKDGYPVIYDRIENNNGEKKK